MSAPEGSLEDRYRHIASDDGSDAALHNNPKSNKKRAKAKSKAKKKDKLDGGRRRYEGRTRSKRRTPMRRDRSEFSVASTALSMSMSEAGGSYRRGNGQRARERVSYTRHADSTEDFDGRYLHTADSYGGGGRYARNLSDVDEESSCAYNNRRSARSSYKRSPLTSPIGSPVASPLASPEVSEDSTVVHARRVRSEGGGGGKEYQVTHYLCVQIVSDVHLEFYAPKLPPDDLIVPSAPVLALLGA